MRVGLQHPIGHADPRIEGSIFVSDRVVLALSRRRPLSHLSEGQPMLKTKLASLATCFIASSSLAADDVALAGPVDDLCRATASCDYEIRERLLSIPFGLSR